MIVETTLDQLIADDPSDDDIGTSYRIERENGILWVFYIKLYGWCYTFVPNDLSFPSIDVGYSSPKWAAEERQSVEDNLASMKGGDLV